jgi:DNA-3-methyladenine glycosylase I
MGPTGSLPRNLPPPAGDEPIRCAWVPRRDPVYQAYHDQEWGVPCHGEDRLFELLVLEGAQAGLSWRTILARREAYRTAFGGFRIEAVAAFTPADLARAGQHPGILRHPGKLEAIVANARAAQRLQDRHGSLEAFCWSFVGGRPRIGHWEAPEQVPASTPLSEALSRGLKEAGFRFVGPTVCYAFMQAAGLVMDHVVSCFRYPQLATTESR